ncbi:alpha/beta fold hydrolase [Leifsonia sp. NPDC058292]|uniref:alpha/beta fold hydrolase n=1 Tax=Leifsonia sp. NPDC058292 TaxID=3346428 RepID=UPI0036DCD1AC
MPDPSPLFVRTSEAAAPTGVPVVLLHGFASSGTDDFETTGWAQTFADAGRTTHIVDLPGHGDSGPVTEAGATTSAVVAQLVDAIDALTDGPVDVVAYSLGARLAWELPNASSARRPESTRPIVRRLVLGGLSPFEPFATVDTDALSAVVAGRDRGDRAAPRPADPMLGMMAAMVSAPGRDTESLIALIRGLGSEPFTPSAGAPAETPILFVAGSDDVMTTGIEDLVALTQNGTLARVPGDHRGALDSPEFRAAALAFLS